MAINYSSLPCYMQDGMRLYVEHGILPGGFLTAVLSNDLMGALGKADDINLHALPAYGRFLYNNAPCGCYGSLQAVASWCKAGGLNGIRAADEVAQ